MIFLGCDGGSTKTEWLLVDHTGQVLAHRIFPGCNFAFWGEDGFRDLMVRSVQTLLADSGITSQQITSAMLSLTVYGEVPGTEEFFPQVMQSILPDCPLQFSNDSVAGWCGRSCPLLTIYISPDICRQMSGRIPRCWQSCSWLSCGLHSGETQQP